MHKLQISNNCKKYSFCFTQNFYVLSSNVGRKSEKKLAKIYFILCVPHNPQNELFTILCKEFPRLKQRFIQKKHMTILWFISVFKNIQ